MMVTRSFFATLLLAGGTFANPTLTSVRDTLYKADGTRFNGTLTITWTSFQAADDSSIVQQSTTVKVSDGNLRVQLVPSNSATPATLYSVTYNSDGRVQFRETWSVPASTQPLLVRQVRVASQLAGGGNPSQQAGTISQSDVVGLTDELAARPIRGPAFEPNRVAMANGLGQLETVTGPVGDCVRVDGTSGPCGPVAPAFVDNETPAGSVDGMNRMFTLTTTPVAPAAIALYRNGVLQKAGADYTITGRNIEFTIGATPQSGDILLASYRVAGSDAGPQPFPLAQVLCSGVGGMTSQTAFDNLGVCTIPAGILAIGDRVEFRFDYQHQGSASGFTVDLQWGSTTVLNRDAAAGETLVTGRADAGLHTAGAQLSAQCWGGSLPVAAAVATASDNFAAGITLLFRGKLASSGGDSLNLRHFSVVRLP